MERQPQLYERAWRRTDGEGVRNHALGLDSSQRTRVPRRMLGGLAKGQCKDLYLFVLNIEIQSSPREAQDVFICTFPETY